MGLSSSEMLALVNAGTPVVWDGRVISVAGQVPSQAEIDRQAYKEYYRNPLQANYQYIVNPVTGNDKSGESNSLAYAFATIQAALNKAATDAAPDAAVLVMPGTYNERLTLKNGVDLHVLDRGVATLEVDSAAPGNMISDAGAAGVAARMTGMWRVRRLGTPTGGPNTLVRVNGIGSDVYIEFAEMYNGCANTLATHVFDTTGGGKLRAKQIAPGLCQSLNYDLYVDEGVLSGDTRSAFELDAWDLIKSGQSIVELSGSFNAADVRIKAKRAWSGAADDMLSVSLIDTEDYPIVHLDISEYMYSPAGMVGWPNEAGILDITCPLMYRADGGPITFGGTKLDVRGADIVAVGTNKICVENVAGLLRFHNCRFFPTGTGRPVDTGSYEAFNCYTKIANATATIVGTNTTATGMAVPASPIA